MKRTDFIKSILGISAMGVSTKLMVKETPVKLEGRGNISSLIGNTSIIKGSDLEVALSINRANGKYKFNK